MAKPPGGKPPASANSTPQPPQARKPFVNGLGDVPEHVRDTRPNEAWRDYVGRRGW
jgi:hypothetical protein